MGVGEGQVLVVVFANQPRAAGYLPVVEGPDRERAEVRNEGQKLDRAPHVISAQKPAVAFGDDQG